MTQLHEKEKQIEGEPWFVHKRFLTFEEADECRAGLFEERDDLQIRVRWSRKRDDFMVKTRVDPAIALKETAEKRRQEKKKRKAKLNKKRRKK
jgi:hypothetical protein